MSNVIPRPFETLIRFNSLEPISQHNDRVYEIADRHGFVAEFNSEQMVNAPICGIDYHVQEIKLTQENDAETVQWVRCINELSQFEQQFLKDSFFEVVE